MRTVYIADDGEMFDDIRLCREHEYNSVEKAIERFESYSKDLGGVDSFQKYNYIGKYACYDSEFYLTKITEDAIGDLMIINHTTNRETCEKYIGCDVLIERYENDFDVIGTKDSIITEMIKEVNEVFSIAETY